MWTTPRWYSGWFSAANGEQGNGLFAIAASNHARDWSRTSTTLRSLAPQASASAYSATRAFRSIIYYWLFTIYSAKLRWIFDMLQYWLRTVNSQFTDSKNMPAIMLRRKHATPKTIIPATSGRGCKRKEHFLYSPQSWGGGIFLWLFHSSVLFSVPAPWDSKALSNRGLKAWCSREQKQHKTRFTRFEIICRFMQTV